MSPQLAWCDSELIGLVAVDSGGFLGFGLDFGVWLLECGDESGGACFCVA